MGLTKTIEKLKKYRDRYDAGDASRIKKNHVEKVINKLVAKEASLINEIAAAAKPEKKARLEQKLATTREQNEKARWLLERIG